MMIPFDILNTARSRLAAYIGTTCYLASIAVFIAVSKGWVGTETGAVTLGMMVLLIVLERVVQDSRAVRRQNYQLEHRIDQLTDKLIERDDPPPEPQP